MLVGVLKEIKDNENRVALTPEGCRSLVNCGAIVYVEKGAGEGSGFKDRDYAESGGIISSVKNILENCELILKIKEPVGHELDYFNSSHTLFTYFHFASDYNLTKKMIDSGANCIAYETVSDENNRTPLLAPMSRVAGRMSVHIGAYYLSKSNGGSGVLLQGIEGVSPGKVVIIGGGVSGSNAADVAIGMGADVTIIEKDPFIDVLAKKFLVQMLLRALLSLLKKRLLMLICLLGLFIFLAQKRLSLFLKS